MKFQFWRKKKKLVQRQQTYYRPSRHGISSELRRAIYRRDGYKCVYCDSPLKLQLDHVHPRFHGGENTYENLVTACQSCNGAKSARLLEGRNVKEKVKNYRAERLALQAGKGGKKKEKYVPDVFSREPAYPHPIQPIIRKEQHIIHVELKK
jgi:5-methylcytosine-specific restriction endonuclease McrA